MGTVGPRTRRGSTRPKPQKPEPAAPGRLQLLAPRALPRRRHLSQSSTHAHRAEASAMLKALNPRLESDARPSKTASTSPKLQPHRKRNPQVGPLDVQPRRNSKHERTPTCPYYDHDSVFCYDDTTASRKMGTSGMPKRFTGTGWPRKALDRWFKKFR